MSCGVGCRLSSDSALLWLWLWRRLAAVAPIRPLTWEPPYAAGAALKRQLKKKKYPVFLQLWHRSQMRLGFDPWPRNSKNHQVRLQHARPGQVVHNWVKEMSRDKWCRALWVMGWRAACVPDTERSHGRALSQGVAESAADFKKIPFFFFFSF